jgi:hypothetical protein
VLEFYLLESADILRAVRHSNGPTSILASFWLQIALIKTIRKGLKGNKGKEEEEYPK